MAAAVCIPAGTADAAARPFRIAPQPLAGALEELGQQAALQIIFTPAVVGDRLSRGVTGALEPMDALRELLLGTGLTFRVSGSGVIIVAGRSGDVAEPARAPDRPQESVAPLLPASVQEVVVTASKRVEYALKVPIAMSVLRGDQLSTLGVKFLSDVQDAAPGVGVSSVAHGVNITIRGVTTTDNTSKGAQGIAYNLDGVYVGRPIEQGLALFDVDRIEVLRGPQGTLYGQSTTGGAINVITRKPTDRLEAYLKLEAGDFAARRAEGAMNLPVTDSLAIRLAGNVDDRQGSFAPSDGGQRKGGQSTWSGRGAALAHFGPDFTARLTLTGGHVGGAGPGSALLSTMLSGDTASQLKVYPNPIGARLDDDFVNLDGEANARLGGVEVTYVGSRQHFDGNEITSNNNNPVGNANAYSWARYLGVIDAGQHEVRLSNAEPAFIDYVVGANDYRERIRENDHQLLAPLSSPTAAASRNSLDILGVTSHYSTGIFGQATAHLTDQLGAVVGLRYSSDGVKRRATLAPGADNGGKPWLTPTGAICIGPQDCVGNPNNGDQEASKITYRAGLNYEPTPTDFFYLSVASGYKPGGFNDIDPETRTTRPYPPETMIAYEAGYKGRPARQLQLTSAFFYYDYSGDQITSAIFIPPPVIYTRLTPARVYGWENEATWRVGRNTSVDLAAAFEKSSFDHLITGFFQDTDWSGQSLDRTPVLVGSVTLNQVWDMPGGWSLRLRALSKFSSSYYVSEYVTPYRFKQKAFSRSDASLTLTAPGEGWYAEAFVQNIENRLQAVGAPTNYNANLLSGSSIAVSDPRAFGLRMGMAFH